MQTIAIGSFGVNVNDDKSPLYIVQCVRGQSVLISERFDAPESDWIKVNASDFWALT